MGDSIYIAFATSVLRSLLLVAGGWLVSRGLVDDNGLMREVAAGLAIIAVTQGVNFWRIHKRVLYQRWLLLLGIAEPPTNDPAVVANVQADAKHYAAKGYQP